MFEQYLPVSSGLWRYAAPFFAFCAIYGAQLSGSDIPEPLQRQEWKRLTACGEQQYAKRQLALAEACYRAAAKIAMEQSWSRLVVVSLSSLAVTLLEQGRVAAGQDAAVRGVLELRKCESASCNPALAAGLRNLAIIYTQGSHFLDAERLLRESLDLYERAGSSALNCADVLNTLAWLELHRNRPAAAESYFRRALTAIRDIKDAQGIRSDLYSGLSTALLDLNRNSEAVEAAQEALTVESSASQRRALEIVRHSCSLAAASTANGDFVLAEQSLISAMAILSQIPDEESNELGLALTAFGTMRAAQGRFAEAAEFDGKAIQVISRHLNSTHPQLLRLKTHYAMVLRKLNRTREAKALERELPRVTGTGALDLGSRLAISVSDLQRESERPRSRDR